MNNEPVAWMSVELNGRTVLATYEFETAIPLYTHPVSQYKAITNTKIEPTVVSYTHPVKELTDEEINDAWKQSHEDGIAMQQGFTTQQHYFAHLILRKAQEK